MDHPCDESPTTDVGEENGCVQEKVCHRLGAYTCLDFRNVHIIATGKEVLQVALLAALVGLRVFPIVDEAITKMSWEQRGDCNEESMLGSKDQAGWFNIDSTCNTPMAFV